jgi:hypothetical protein
MCAKQAAVFSYTNAIPLNNWSLFRASNFLHVSCIVSFYSQKPQEALNLLVTEECY